MNHECYLMDFRLIEKWLIWPCCDMLEILRVWNDILKF